MPLRIEIRDKPHNVVQPQTKVNCRDDIAHYTRR